MRLRVYLLVIHLDLDPRAKVLEFLDTRREIKNWFAFLPSAVMVVSDSDASTLAELVHSRFPEHLFMIAEINSHAANGWLPANVWDFLGSPRSSGRWPEGEKE